MWRIWRVLRGGLCMERGCCFSSIGFLMEVGLKYLPYPPYPPLLLLRGYVTINLDCKIDRFHLPSIDISDMLCGAAAPLVRAWSERQGAVGDLLTVSGCDGRIGL